MFATAGGRELGTSESQVERSQILGVADNSIDEFIQSLFTETIHSKIASPPFLASLDLSYDPIVTGQYSQILDHVLGLG